MKVEYQVLMIRGCVVEGWDNLATDNEEASDMPRT